MVLVFKRLSIMVYKLYFKNIFKNVADLGCIIDS